MVEVDDFAQQFEVKIIVDHKEDWDEEANPDFFEVKVRPSQAQGELETRRLGVQQGRGSTAVEMLSFACRALLLGLVVSVAVRNRERSRLQVQPTTTRMRQGPPPQATSDQLKTVLMLGEARRQRRRTMWLCPQIRTRMMMMTLYLLRTVALKKAMWMMMSSSWSEQLGATPLNPPTASWNPCCAARIGQRCSWSTGSSRSRATSCITITSCLLLTLSAITQPSRLPLVWVQAIPSFYRYQSTAACK